MASVQATLTGATPVTVNLPAPTGRIVVTIVGGAAEVYVTADGSYPSTPSATNNLSDLRVIPGVLGAQVVMQPPLFGDHMVLPTLNFASAGTPTVQIEW